MSWSGATGISTGSGKSRTENDSGAANSLAALASQFAEESSPIRQGLLSSMQEVLKTGGSTLPIIQRATEQSRLNSSNALRQLDERLAQTGLAGTPEGERVRGQQVQAGEIAAGQTAESLAQQIFAAIPNFILGQAQTAAQGYAGAVPGTLVTREKSDAIGQNTTVGKG